METRFIEAGHSLSGGNWGKFMLARFTAEEWSRPSALEAHLGVQRSLLRGRGWTPENLLVVDLQTGEGAIFLPGGLARADLEKHAVWVCPLFSPFLAWLYTQDLTSLEDLPSFVELPGAEFQIYGHRRGGPGSREAPSVGAPEPTVAGLMDLMAHAWLHSAYPDCGYWEMTSEQKALYNQVLTLRGIDRTAEIAALAESRGG